MKRLVFLVLFVLGCGDMVTPFPPSDDAQPRSRSRSPLRRVCVGSRPPCYPVAQGLPGHQGVDIDGDYTDPIFSSDDLKDAASTDQDAVVDH